MVHTRIGDLFSSGAQTLVNTVNCVGVMGKGIALEFKTRYPNMFRDYALRCANGQVRLGEPYLFRGDEYPWVLNFPTKDHWRSVSKLSDIVRGLEYIEDHCQEWGLESLAVPPLGCGLGQLEWRVVGPTLFRHLDRLGIPVTLFAPHGTSPAELEEAFLSGKSSGLGKKHQALLFSDEPEISATAGNQPVSTASRFAPAWLALVEVVARLENEPHHRPIGRTAFQKIAYFATQLGIPTGLEYKKSSYGPFAADLKKLLTRLVNNGLVVEENIGKMLRIKPGPTYRDSLRTYRTRVDEWSPIIDKVADLFLRIRSLTQAEIVATVHFVAKSLHSRGSKPTELDVFRGVKEWKKRRRPPLSDEQIAEAVRNMNILGLVDLDFSSDLPVFDELLHDA